MFSGKAVNMWVSRGLAMGQGAILAHAAAPIEAKVGKNLKDMGTEEKAGKSFEHMGSGENS